MNSETNCIIYDIHGSTRLLICRDKIQKTHMRTINTHPGAWTRYNKSRCPRWGSLGEIGVGHMTNWWTTHFHCYWGIRIAVQSWNLRPAHFNNINTNYVPSSKDSPLFCWQLQNDCLLCHNSRSDSILLCGQMRKCREKSFPINWSIRKAIYFVLSDSIWRTVNLLIAKYYSRTLL